MASYFLRFCNTGERGDCWWRKDRSELAGLWKGTLYSAPPLPANPRLSPRGEMAEPHIGLWVCKQRALATCFLGRVWGSGSTTEKRLQKVSRQVGPSRASKSFPHSEMCKNRVIISSRPKGELLSPQGDHWWEWGVMCQLWTGDLGQDGRVQRTDGHKGCLLASSRPPQNSDTTRKYACGRTQNWLRFNFHYQVNGASREIKLSLKN